MALPSHSNSIEKKRPDIDQIGMTASLVCAIHCALMPLVITLLPLLGLGFMAHEKTEWILVGISMLLAVGSLCLGFRQHRQKTAFAVLGAGLTILLIGRIGEHNGVGRWGTVLVVLGGVSIACAHWLNRKLCLSCHACHPDHS